MKFYLNLLQYDYNLLFFQLKSLLFRNFTTYVFILPGEAVHFRTFLTIINCQCYSSEYYCRKGTTTCLGTSVCGLTLWDIHRPASQSTFFVSFAKTRPSSYSKAPDIFGQIATVPSGTRGINCSVSFFFPFSWPCCQMWIGRAHFRSRIYIYFAPYAFPSG